MNRKHLARFVLLLSALLAFFTAASAGGWATITVNEFPEYAVAGKPLDLTFSVRHHGQTLLSGLKPSVQATTTGDLVAKAAAVATRTPGEYTAALTLPQPGDWKITINSGFAESTAKLPSLRVVAAGSPAPAPFAPATQGLRLFTTKGCNGCHRHPAVNPSQMADARLDLTAKHFNHDYLKRFLADPGIKPAEMPKLNLKEDEIAALAEFINKGSMKKKNLESGAAQRR